MKNVIAFVLVLVSLSVSAQNLSFGVTGGIGHSWTNSPKSTLNRMFHPYYNIGGKMVYSFVTNWGVSADIRFSSEGQTIGTNSNNKGVVRANYIRIPLQGIFFFGKFGERVRPKISAGPSFGFFVGGKSKLITNGSVVTKQQTKEYWKGTDFGLTVAAGGNVRIAKATWLNLDIAYYHGLTNVAETGDAKNRNLGIDLGVTFPLATLLPDKIKG
jgi:hypothetical protein